MRDWTIALGMDRRVFIAGAIALSATPLGAGAQPAGRIYRIGVIHVGDHSPPGLGTLRAGLTTMGYEEGKNLQLDFRNLPDENAARETARIFLSNQVDLIVAFGNPTIRAARAASSETPIVMIHATDPVREQFVSTLARPGGNVTGFVFFAVSPGKHLELMKEMVPRLRRVLVLTDPQDPVSSRQLAEMRTAATRLASLELVERQATGRVDLERVFASISPGNVDGVVSASIDLQIKFTSLLIQLSSSRRLPLASYRREAAQQGALFSYAPDDAAVGRRAADYVDRILKGTRPADLPVEQPTKFELVVNLKTAKALGLTIPPSLLLRADQVIE